MIQFPVAVTATQQRVKPKDTRTGNRTGPIRAPEHSGVCWDSRLDTCKDHDDTGSCKFPQERWHCRHGWHIPQEPHQGRDGASDDGNDEGSSHEGGLPFKCFICRGSFENPVVTECWRCFCESCALQRHRKSRRCRICDKQSNLRSSKPAKELKAGKTQRRKKRSSSQSTERIRSRGVLVLHN